MINKKSIEALYLIVIATILVIGISFLGVGIKNYSDSDKIAKLIEPSSIHKDQGYSSIGEWKTSYENKSLVKIFIGVGVFGVAVALAYYKKRKMTNR